MLQEDEEVSDIANMGDLLQRVIVQMIRKADLGQACPQRCLGHGFAGVVAVKGNTGMHMKIKHCPVPPRTGEMLWAAPPAC